MLAHYHPQDRVVKVSICCKATIDTDIVFVWQPHSCWISFICDLTWNSCNFYLILSKLICNMSELYES